MADTQASAVRSERVTPLAGTPAAGHVRENVEAAPIEDEEPRSLA